MITFLNGYKTYILAGVAVLGSLVSVLTGDMTIAELTSSPNLIILLQALFAATIRHGVDTK